MHPFEPPSRLPDGLRFLTTENVAGLFQFPIDMRPVDVEVNRLNDQVLVRYYEREWSAIAH
jgi:spermidine synthase